MPGPSDYDPIRDGYATLFTLGAFPGIQLYERETTPPGIDGGGPIESTTMRNARWRTKDPKTLVGIGDVMATVCYASAAYEDILTTAVNTPDSLLLFWPDGATLLVNGYVDKFSPTGHSEGNLPTANFVFVITNRNPTTGAEEGPVFTPAP